MTRLYARLAPVELIVTLIAIGVVLPGGSIRAAPAAEGAAEGALEEIVVTATKRAKSVRDVPITIRC
jgi:hypothetical protein